MTSTESQNDNWIDEQGWQIRTIPEEAHIDFLEYSLKEYPDIWEELVEK